MKTFNPIYSLAASAAACMLFVSCSKPTTIEINYLSAQQEGDTNWGMIAPDGKMLFSDEFENRPNSVFNGYFTVSEEDGMSVYKAEKNPKLVPGLDGLYDAGFYSEGLIPVTRQNSRIEMVDNTGKTVFTLMPIDGREVIHVNGFYNGGVCQFQLEDGTFGAINTAGEVVIDPIWTGIYWFNDGVAYATRDDERTDAIYIIDPDGNELCRLASSLHPFAYSFMYDISPAYKSAGDERIAGFINKKGEFARVSSKIYEISEWTNDYFTYSSNDGKYGVMSMKGDVLIRPKYEMLLMIGDNRFLAMKNSETYAVVTLDGDEIARLHGEVERLLPATLDMFSSKISMIYTDKKGRVYLLNNKGEYNESEPMENIAFFTPSQTVDSRYFNVEGAAQSLVSDITDNGYGTYRLGTTMSEYCDNDPESYRNSTSLDGVETSSAMYTISTVLRSNQSIVYDSTPSAYYYTWSFRPSSKLDYIDVTLSPNQEVDGLAQAVHEALTQNGWSLDGDQGTKGDMKINIVENDKDITITLSLK